MSSIPSGLPRPEPAAGLEAYSAELKLRLAYSERTRANWERYKAAKRTARPDYLPIRLDVENVSRCNFACTMCAVSKWPKGRRAPDMSLDCFKRLIDAQYGVVEVKLNGLGEPLMGRHYFDMIRFARWRHIWVRMTTNASLLHVNGNYRELVDSGVNDIDISIDGADKATFESIRIQSDFDQVVANCATLNAYCAAKGVKRTKMWTLVQKGNSQNLAAHVKLAQTLGFKHMIFSVQLHGWGDKDLAKRNAGEEVGIGKNESAYLIALGRSLGVRVAFWDVSVKFDRQNLCPWPFERSLVSSDMRVVPCCMIGSPDAYEFGHGEPLTELWQGEQYVKFRQDHIDGEIPAICRSCYKHE